MPYLSTLEKLILDPDLSKNLIDGFLSLGLLRQQLSRTFIDNFSSNPA